MNFALRETTYEPPAETTRAVDMSYTATNLMPQPGKVEIAKLVFDSASQPVPAGVRGTVAIARELLYRAGSLCIDMRLQSKPGSDSRVLIGQLLDSANPNHGIGGIPISLLSQGDTVSKAKTNNVGEFDFGLAVRGDLQLVFGMGKGKKIVVPVPDTETTSA